MRNKYLLLGAASALMLAACSEDVKGPGMDPAQPAENALNLTSLSSASQAGRVSFPGETRGQKADRLQLVAKIAPLTDAATKHWSATGIAIANGNAYVSWHSDHQASVQATEWGGALDEINIKALLKEVDAPVITSTQTSSQVKFNNVVAAGSNLYFPLTCYKNGAVVGRLQMGGDVIDTIAVPGSSANAIAVDGTTLYVATGYEGGAYSMPTTFDKETEITTIAAKDKNFGGKYIDNGNILRTDETNAYLLPLAGGAEVKLDAPLVAGLKFAETYDPTTGTWSNTGDKAAYYGKHTMAKAGGYTYVGAGKNGIRVYSATSNGEAVWSNGNYTTAVAAAELNVSETDKQTFIFAATGMGLRVYEPYSSEKGELPLYAFEVLNYDENGMAADAPNSNKPAAGTDAHSSNFVAVDTVNGLIFVACGQSGVYVFRLDTTVAPKTAPTGFVTPNGDGIQEIEVDSDPVKIKVPELPEGYDKWVDNEGNPYKPGDEYEFKPGETIELTPVKVVVYTLSFNGWAGKESEITNVPDAKVQEENLFVIPEEIPVWGERKFWGWSTEKANYNFEDENLLHAGDTFSIPEGTDFTLYGVWSSKMEGGASTGSGSGSDVKPDPDPEPDPTPDDPVIGGETTNGKE